MCSVVRSLRGILFELVETTKQALTQELTRPCRGSRRRQFRALLHRPPHSLCSPPSPPACNRLVRSGTPGQIVLACSAFSPRPAAASGMRGSSAPSRHLSHRLLALSARDRQSHPRDHQMSETRVGKEEVVLVHEEEGCRAFGGHHCYMLVRYIELQRSIETNNSVSSLGLRAMVTLRVIESLLGLSFYVQDCGVQSRCVRR